MQVDINTGAFFIGLALIVIGIIGGGIEIKEVKIPTLPMFPRAMSFIVGFALVLLCLKTELISPSASKATAVTTATSVTRGLTDDKSKLFLGAAIQNGLISVPEVKMVLHHLGTYNGSINDDPSEIYFKAIGNFQLSQNIPADGLVGPVTYGKLREVAPQFFTTK